LLTKIKTTSFFWFLLIIQIGLSTIAANASIPQDTLLSAPNDTLKTLTPPPKSDLEGPIKYWADHIGFSMSQRKTYLTGKVKIVYQQITLTAGKISIDWKRNRMIAEGIADSTDSLGNAVTRDYPVLTEKGREPITGIRLEYNFKTQRGKILEGRTKMEPGYYYGKEITKVGEKTLFIRNGTFTTCDLEHPHYYFYTSKMRLKVNKVGVAKPIIMYIADVPVMAVPFGIFPLQKGRRSGIIMPVYGENNYGGRYLERFGFYWAASQYWDATLLANFYEKTGIVYSGEVRYAKRYSFSGNIRGRFAPRDVLTGAKKQRWELTFSHRQTIGKTVSVNASGSFVSDRTFRQQYYNDIERRLDQSLTTSLVIRKNWPSSRNSLSLSMRRTENLQSGQIDYEIPNLSFSMPSRNLFPLKKGSGKRGAWYNEIKYNFNSNLLSRGSRKPIQDTSGVTTFLRTTKSGWRHNFSTSFSKKFFKYISTQEAFTFQEVWVPEYLNYRWVDSLNTAVADTVKRFRARHTFSTSISALTTLYGLWEIPFLPVKIIRHKMNPSISFNFTPDFSKPSYGYIQTFRDSTGREIKRDRFAGSLFGGTPTGAIQSMKISIQNFFQGKIIRDGKEKKINLFRLNFNSSYNFLADSLKWSDISTSLSATPSRNFNFRFSASHTFYRAGHGGKGKRNEYVWEKGRFSLPRLLRLSFSADLSLKPPEKKKIEADTTQQSLYGLTTSIAGVKVLDELRGFKLPWDLNLKFTYNYNRSDINNPTQNFNVIVRARLELTKNWRIDYNARIDLIRKNLNYQSFSIYRDLHCWEMFFSWQPTGAFSSFRLEIRIKASALRDIKLTKTSRGRPVF